MYLQLIWLFWYRGTTVYPNSFWDIIQPAIDSVSIELSAVSDSTQCYFGQHSAGQRRTGQWTVLILTPHRPGQCSALTIAVTNSAQLRACSGQRVDSESSRIALRLTQCFWTALMQLEPALSRTALTKKLFKKLFKKISDSKKLNENILNPLFYIWEFF